MTASLRIKEIVTGSATITTAPQQTAACSTPVPDTSPMLQEI